MSEYGLKKKLGIITIKNNEYVMWENNEGFIELYRTVEKKVKAHGQSFLEDVVERHETNVKADNKEGLVGWFKKKKRKKPYNPYKDENQKKIV